MWTIVANDAKILQQNADVTNESESIFLFVCYVMSFALSSFRCMDVEKSGLKFVRYIKVLEILYNRLHYIGIYCNIIGPASENETESAYLDEFSSVHSQFQKFAFLLRQLFLSSV